MSLVVRFSIIDRSSTLVVVVVVVVAAAIVVVVVDGVFDCPCV